jgi:flagella basal body P-ring formation protein FlgA
MFWALVIVPFASITARAADLTLELPGVIEARDGSFYLGEYATFEGAQEIVDSASMCLISPTGGEFSAADVIEALGGTEVAGLSVTLRMPDAVRVLPESELVSRLRALTSWKWRIEVEGISGSNLGEFSLPPRVLPGARSLTIKLAGRNGNLANKQVKLRWFQPVVYTTQALLRDSKPDLSSLKLRIETVGMTTPMASDVEQLQHSTMRRAVQGGESIALGDVSDADVIRSGHSVKLVAMVNGLGIEVQGIALQRGGIGDVIRVRNLSSRKILSGTVIDVGRVQIKN